MNCEEILHLISGHIDGENTQEEQLRLQKHLEECVSCRQLLEELQKNDVHIAEAGEVPCGFCEGVMDRIRQEKAAKKRNVRLWSCLAASAAAVALFLGINGLPLPETDHMKAAGAFEAQAETARYVQEKSVYDAEPEVEECVPEEGADEALMDAAAPMCQAVTEALPEAQLLADRLGGVVVCLQAEAEEVFGDPAQETEDGLLYYVLTDEAEAEELCQAYGGTLYRPKASPCEGAYAYICTE